MFNNTKPNIILMSDYTSTVFMQRSLGVSKVASELRRAGYEVLVVNHLHIFSLEEIKDILAKAISDKTLFVGFNTVFYSSIEQTQVIQDGKNSWEQGGKKYGPKQLGAFLPHGRIHNVEIRELIKTLNPECKIVLGGPDAQDREHNSDYDYVVFGLADQSAVNLANHLSNGEPLKNSRRSLFKFTILDDAKAEGYDFIGTQMQYHEHDIVLPGETLPIEIARGCIFNCKFCSFPLNGKKKNDFIKYEDVLYAEFLDNYEKYGVTRYVFSDDTFNDSKGKLEMLYSISKKLPFKLEYWAYSRLDLLTAHPETVDLLYGSGCRGSFFGIESLNQAAAASIGKGGSRDNLLATIRRIKNTYGDSVALHGAFIFGLPMEDVSSIKRTMEQILSSETALDSWFANPLRLRKADGAPFASDLDKNFEKYGYRITGFDEIQNVFIWENDYTNYPECKALAESLHNQSIATGALKIKGLESFFMSSLGFDLNYSMNCVQKTFDWHSISLAKDGRVEEYKSRLLTVLGAV